MNYFDPAAGHAACFPAYGKALADCRGKVYLQIHFGANYMTGEYGWTTDLEKIKRSIDWQLTKKNGRRSTAAARPSRRGDCGTTKAEPLLFRRFG